LFAGLSGSASRTRCGTPRAFTKNRDRLLDVEVAGNFLVTVLLQDKVKKLLSSHLCRIGPAKVSPSPLQRRVNGSDPSRMAQ
jgi:hypothetical protein